MARSDPAINAHLEWLGFVRPTGLVVSAPALVRAGAILNTHDRTGQKLLAECAMEREKAEGTVHVLPDFEVLAGSVLGWSFSPKGYAGTDEAPIPDELRVHLPDFGETLAPDFAVRERSPEEAGPSWQLLVRILDEGTGFDANERVQGSTLDASPHGRMERLLRQTGVQAGLLFNGVALRLISAPRGESSGWLDFRVEEMIQTAGRPICAAMRLLLGESRLLSLPKDQRLTALLEDSRKFQNEVSEKLAEQVLHALYELLRGMQAAHDQSKGVLLREVLREDPDKVYRALLTVLLRIVFLLYAEEREMLPSEDEVYQRYYGIAGLHERLREDAAQYPDTLGQRYGAWAQLLSLFRIIYDGAELGSSSIPQRHGVLFDPNRFPFLEGRPEAGGRQVGERIDPPLVPDGTVYRALEKLLVLDGERISYRALDVEQIGSVYETMMGFRLETASGRSLAIRSKARYGAPATADLDALLDVAPGKRRKWLQDMADRKVSASVNRELKAAETVNELHAALRPVADLSATPDLVPPGAMILQPSEERRKSGSHYTPRSLTEPIVKKTLEPLLQALEEEAEGPPRSEQILDLKICDPAMGSGAFLVETCRQLGEALLDAWKAHDGVPPLPSDEDERVFARRLVAQRCIYGVDRNPVAVDLAKVSLWLVTLARDHAFTFLDHALRHGDSLVGLSRKQIEQFHWDAESADHQAGFEAMRVQEHVERVHELRKEIRNAGEAVADWELRNLWDDADHKLAQVRLFGDLVIAAFFEGSKQKEREAKLAEYAQDVVSGAARKHRGRLEEMRSGDPPLAPFHWEVEFPEVFDRENGGFDGFVGNPPFAGVTSLSESNLPRYTDWLRLAPGTGGKCDLVAFFFRRTFGLLRQNGTMGLIATKTIAQGDTRRSGLTEILRRGGTIYDARRRVPWPGKAAVIVSVVHLRRGPAEGDSWLDGKAVRRISALLLDSDIDDDPAPLTANEGLAFLGSKTQSIGFVISSSRSGSPSTDELKAVLVREPTSNRFIRGYVGGEDLMRMVTPGYPHQVIDVGDLDKEAIASFPVLLSLLREYVWPSRRSKSGSLKERWWHFGHRAHELYSALEDLDRFLVIPRNSNTFAFRFLPVGGVVNDKIVAFPLVSYSAFCALQARPHEIWARTFSTTLKDDLQYTPTDCLVTYPFVAEFREHSSMEAAARTYYEFRANLMIRNDEGLTQTYNRFHDPNERDDPDILRLRELHAEMDRAVLDAYGWDDIPTDCEFLLDYEIDEENWNPRKKKPWRYRWPDEVHDEVLARLLELNEKRAEAERMGVKPAETETRGSRKETSSASSSSANHDLFEE